jgi:uncharacterized membrane protein YdbT with pleckstrin-like domain
VFLPLTVVAVVFSLIPLAIVPAAIGLIIVVIAHLRRNSSEFAVTNRRIIIKVGFMSTRSIELLLPKVEAITVNQTVAGRMFGYGDIIVTGSGGTKEQVAGIQVPRKVTQSLQAEARSATGSGVSGGLGVERVAD